MNVLSCMMTRTRLMGVLAGYIDYTVRGHRVVEFYHIEFEEYGIDRFEHYINPSDYQIKQAKLEIFGGLGGGLVSLSPDEFKQLIIAGVAVNPSSEHIEDVKEHSDWFKQDKPFDASLFGSAIGKVVEQMRSPYEMIHYFIMRYIGRDTVFLRYSLLDYPFLECRYTLMRNHIERDDEGTYHFSALVLSDDYAILEGVIKLDGEIVSDYQITSTMAISDVEAALMLRQSEFIYVYDVDEPSVESHLIQEHKYLAPMLYKHGRLYTCYRRHNDHVNSKTFYLNGDVEIYFYFTDSNQLLLCSNDRNAMLKWDDVLGTRFNYDVDKYEEWEFEESILYDFIASDMIDFDDYVENLGV